MILSHDFVIFDWLSRISSSSLLELSSPPCCDSELSLGASSFCSSFSFCLAPSDKSESQQDGLLCHFTDLAKLLLITDFCT